MCNVSYHCLNPIAEKGLNLFGEEYRKTEASDGADAVLCQKCEDARYGDSGKCSCRSACRRGSQQYSG